jgi:dynein heavy chain
MQPCISFQRSFLKEIVPSVDNNLCESLMRILDCYMYPYVAEEGRPHPTDVMIADMVTCMYVVVVTEC